MVWPVSVAGGLCQRRHGAESHVEIDRSRYKRYFNPFLRVDRMSKQAKSPTFESALAELENIVASMEAGQLPLEQLLSAYKRGAELLQFCQQALQDAQQQVRILEAGNLLNFSVDTDAQGSAGKAEAGDD